MEQEKILTIIIPTYNAEQFLDKGLMSLQIEDQELFEKIQIIVVNDGSSDHSAEIAQKYIDRKPKVYEIINKENGGHGSGINAGVKQAKGKYVKVIDADDWVDTREFEKFVKYLSDCRADVVISDYKTYDIGTKEEKKYTAHMEGITKTYNLSQVMEKWTDVDKCLTFWGVAYRTDFYRNQNYQLLENVFYEDQEFATIPMSRARTVCFCECCVYVYRIGDVNQSVSVENQIKRLSHLWKVIFKMAEMEEKLTELPEGGASYWKKKTSMVVTSFYQIALLKNANKKDGRKQVRELNAILSEKRPLLYSLCKKKGQCFEVMSYLHMTNHFYEVVVIKIIQMIRGMTHSI